jgi:hypothetical protein
MSMFSKIRARRHANGNDVAEDDLKTARPSASTPEPAASNTAPPSYQDSTQTNTPITTDTHPLTTPPFDLTFVPIAPPPHPIAIHMQGDYRTPNFSVTLPSIPTGPPHPPIPLFEIDTDSTLVFHHSHIRDLRAGGTMHTLKRATIPSTIPSPKPRTTITTTSSSSALPTTTGAQTETYRYTIHSPGSQGRKHLEITTEPALLTAPTTSTKLIFRDHASSDLDALTLRLLNLSSFTAPQMDILHQNAVVGRIVLLGKESAPALKLECAARVDRWMTPRRRLKREFGAGVAGVGKGPGAGLAGAYALGGG